ncbi:DUF7878 domain-containing protein [Crossiella cryophila]|uniref:DUF7878 domain-containing protein n=1 Tax=Crossiella cryophila TaxID=43355 RepID=A0A7W7C5S8_9PSEU|nr:hypothetical protein [Crossiella cryophila]MBB4673936.1 hypothetical protein [Crossiella cryophila]
MVELELTGLAGPGSGGHSAAEISENVEGTLRLLDDGRELYAEQDFPVVKLAAALRRWLAVPAAGRASFSFDDDSFAMSQGVLVIDRVPDGWRFGSVYAPGEFSAALPDTAADQVVLIFLATLRREFAQLLGRELEQYC